MNLVIIIVLVVVLVLTLTLVTLFLISVQKHRKRVLERVARELNSSYKRVTLEKLDEKELPVKIEEIKDDIYFCTKAVTGEYEKSQRIINEKNWNATEHVKKSNITVFCHYNAINWFTPKFMPLNNIDLVLTKDKLYLYHPLEPETVTISKMKDITIYWERNSLIERKKYYPGVAFNYKNKNYFLLFQSYKQVLLLLSYLNLLS